MACEQLTRLGDVIELEDVKREPISSRDRKDRKGSYPYYGAQGIVDYLDDYTYEGDYLLVAEDGENLRSRKNPIANAASGKFRVNNHAHVIAESEKCNLVFLRHLLNMTDISAYVTGSTQPKLSQSNLCAMKLPLPSMAEQNAIANVLSLFDRKIELNNQLNDYLFELVSSVFAHRFSDNVNTTELKNVLSISTKALKPQEHADEIWEHYSIPAFDEKHRPIFEPASGIKSNKYQIDSECILISKLNPSTKRIWMPCCSSNNAVCSTEFIVYRPYLKEYKSFYYAAIDSPRFTDYLLEHVSGSTGSRQRAQPKDTLNYLMPNPDNEEIKDFCIFADPIYRHIQINEQQTAKLELLRETLLPKLMSGTIDVSKVDLTQLTNNHLADY